MKDLISREALKKRLGDLHFHNYGYAIIAVMEAPAVEAVEVVHGRWIEKIGRAKCSVCADECWADSALEYNYCPNCGAKMET